MIWVIFRFEDGNVIEVEIEANSFDEALKQARAIHPDFVGGYVKKR